MATAIQYGFSRIVPRPGYALVLRLPDDADPSTFYGNVLAVGEPELLGGTLKHNTLRPAPGDRVLVEEMIGGTYKLPGNPLAVFVQLTSLIAVVPA